MSTNDYGMPMSPRPEGTAVLETELGRAAIEAPPRTARPRGFIELRDGAGTMTGDIARTGSGLLVDNGRLKEKNGDSVRQFHRTVNVPWSAVLYWSTSGQVNS